MNFSDWPTWAHKLAEDAQHGKQIVQRPDMRPTFIEGEAAVTATRTGEAFNSWLAEQGEIRKGLVEATKLLRKKPGPKPKVKP